MGTFSVRRAFAKGVGDWSSQGAKEQRAATVSPPAVVGTGGGARTSARAKHFSPPALCDTQTGRIIQESGDAEDLKMFGCVGVFLPLG